MSGKIEYKVTERQSAGVLAVLSPQMDWFKNVSLAERVLVFWTKYRDRKWDKAMSDFVHSKAAVARTDSEKDVARKMLAVEKKARGKTIADLQGEDKAVFLRVFDETYFERRYRLVTPEGGFEDYVSNLDGSFADVAWGGLGTY